MTSTKPKGLTLGTMGAVLALLGCGGASMNGIDPNNPAGNSDGATSTDMATGPVTPDPVRTCMQQSLPRLTVSGNQLQINCNGQLMAARLKGINRSGLQHKNGLAMAGFGSDPLPELKAWRDTWQAVVVRIPIGQSYYTTYGEAPQYRQGVAAIVAAAKSLGMYVMLELHGYDASNLNSAQPDPSSTPQFWGDVVRTFGNETHVIFDIWNEPWGVDWSVWKGNAVKIIQAIRGAGANDTLIIVGGLDYAYDLSALQTASNRITGIEPIIYATHPYPLKSNPPSMSPEWDTKFGNIAQQVPVIVGEYGVDDSGTSPYGLGNKAAAHNWMTQLHNYIDAHQLSALAWSAGDEPQIVQGKNGGGVYLPGNPPDPTRPTDPFGVDVKAWMVKPLM